MFGLLRFEYYLAGRQLWFSKAGHLYSPKLMLGYAIETSLKHGLLIIEDAGVSLDQDAKSIRGKSHDLKELLSTCVRYNLFSTIDTSDDFLDFATKGLNSRYPKHIRDNFDEASNRDPYLLTINVGETIGYYDDLMLKLDDEIWSITNKPEFSVGFRGSSQASSATGKIFFHCNLPAMQRLKKYHATVSEHRSHHVSDIESLNKGEEFLWKYEDRSTISKSTSYDSSTFKYKSVEETEITLHDGTKIIDYGPQLKMWFHI
ncbi:hypothetical protein COV05_04160 [Candidatus Uhrbacteria bacterium CG10_big_fil_rev_8_21_14_0_10_48_16]|uniref:Uncharacterized protein n=1 Tax=Candidatus Uhrbacteria bacterium CG10_big_fil_rev_8_21_14_0_10_48_16 TaxID=1975038 RepID=A0A2M8LGF6_9BACT|nr:MAG: hypothetical protein COV05_04160 [Candidatus Uhrbacteria bacterium CG10_big_fil_rev_8_21_14_0_10_48_16]